MKLFNIRQLSFGLRQLGGRSGSITCPRRGHLVKRLYRFLDTKRMVLGNFLIVQQYLYDPNRSGFISLLMMKNGILFYILAPNYPVQQSSLSNLQEPLRKNEKGSSNFLKYMSLGSMIFNIELTPNAGSVISRSAGTFSVILSAKKLKNKVILKLKSGEHRVFSHNCIASHGVVSNHLNFLVNYNKAGTTRLHGRRPRVRPSSMNPVDHPMAGRTRGGCAPQNRKGLLSHGVKTATKKSHNLIITSARTIRLKKTKNKKN